MDPPLSLELNFSFVLFVRSLGAIRGRLDEIRFVAEFDDDVLRKEK